MNPLFRLRRSVWHDAVARYWRGAVLVGAPGVYLWREWPPWQLRAALWALEPSAAGFVASAIALAYIALTAGPTRSLVASKRLIYWRQFPISGREWGLFHGLNLALLHSPFGVLVGYMLGPLGFVTATALATGGLATVVVPMSLRLRAPLGDPAPLRWRRPRHPRIAAFALPRLLWLTLLRRRPTTVVVLLILEAGLVALGIAAVGNLAEVDSRAAFRSARGFMAAATCVGSLTPLFAWPLLAKDRWCLDGLGVGPRRAARASLYLGMLTLPLPALGLLSIGARLSTSDLAVVIATTVIALGAAVWLGVLIAALRQRPQASDERMVAATGLGFGLIVGLATAAPSSLAVLSAIAWLSTRRLVERADQTRRRFALEPSGDNHE